MKFTALTFLVENLDAIGLVGATVLSWFGVKRSSKTIAGVERVLELALDGAAALLIAAPPLADVEIDRALERAAWAALARFGVKRGKTTDRLVARACALVGERVRVEIIRRNLAKLDAAAARVPAAFEAT